jgi:hypothetical protein
MRAGPFSVPHWTRKGQAPKPPARTHARTQVPTDTRLHFNTSRGSAARTRLHDASIRKLSLLALCARHPVKGADRVGGDRKVLLAAVKALGGVGGHEGVAGGQHEIAAGLGAGAGFGGRAVFWLGLFGFVCVGCWGPQQGAWTCPQQSKKPNRKQADTQRPGAPCSPSRGSRPRPTRCHT